MAHFATYGKYPASHANRGSYRNFRLDSFGNRRNILRHLHMMQQTLQLRLLAGRRRPQTTCESLNHLNAICYKSIWERNAHVMFLHVSYFFFMFLPPPPSAFLALLVLGVKKKKEYRSPLAKLSEANDSYNHYPGNPQATSLHTCKSFKYWPVVECHPHLLTIVVLPH